MSDQFYIELLKEKMAAYETAFSIIEHTSRFCDEKERIIVTNFLLFLEKQLKEINATMENAKDGKPT